MFTQVAAWMAAAHAALDAASGLSDAVVSYGPLVTFDNIDGADLVIVGHDDDDETGRAWEFDGGWHEIGANAVHSGEATVFLTLVSQSGGVLTMPDRVTAAGTLQAAVRAVLQPSPSGSALGVSGVLWAQESNVRAHLLPTPAGAVVRLVLSYTIAVLA
jgi:hypothetical protein